jgi:lipoate-protein ligase A
VEEAQTRNRVAMAKVATADEAKAKEAAARSVEEWIKRIRDLKNAGRQDDAAKELAAFRTAYGERADALLPADLRAMQAQPATK